MATGNCVIPLDVFRRLPCYLEVLGPLRSAERTLVSEAHLARELGIGVDQVRADLAHIGWDAYSPSGLAVAPLIEAIRTGLGWEDLHRAVLVGAGHLGRSLATYPAFRQLGIEIVAAFDNDPALVGRSLGNVPVLSTDRLETMVARLHVHLGILTVPAAAAQATAERLAAAGIRALWNFAPCTLNLPDDVVVKNEDLSPALASLMPFGPRRSSA